MSKSLKRIICLVLSMLMVTCVGMSAVATEDPEPDLTFTVASVSGAAGYNVTVGVSIDKSPNLGAVKFDINYDAEKLEFVGYDDGALTDWVVSGYTGCKDSLREGEKPAAVWSSGSGSTATGTILKLKFKVDEALSIGDTATVFLSGFDVADINETEITVTAESGTVTVSDCFSIIGSLLTWNIADDVEFYIYDASVSDKDIRAEWQSETFTYGTECAADKSAILPKTVDGKQLNVQTFELAGIAPGTYKLAICKEGKYCPRIFTVDLTSGNADLGENQLWLYGDINNDGKIKSNDGTQMTRYFNGLSNPISEITDTELQGYVMIVADVNEDGKIKSNDGTQATRYFNGLSSSIDDFR